jgi:hypothetical protein
MRRVAFALAGLALILVIWWLFPTDARRVRAACRDLAQLLTVPPNEPDVARLGRIARLGRSLDPDIVIETDTPGERIEGRDLVLGLVARVAPAGGVNVSIDRIDVTIEDDAAGNRAATGTATVTAREPAQPGQPEHIDVRDLTMRWVNTQEGWLLSHVQAQRSHSEF